MEMPNIKVKNMFIIVKNFTIEFRKIIYNTKVPHHHTWALRQHTWVQNKTYMGVA